MNPLRSTPWNAVRALLALLASLAVLIPSAVLLGGSAHAAAPPAGSATRYTMTAFTYGSETDMYVYDSPDGTTFNLVKGPAYTPPSGLVRDPSIMKHTDGYYYVTYTSGWNTDQIGFARSTDRQNWTFLGNITLGLSGIGNAWAPEWFVDPGDGSVNIIVSLHLNSEASGVFHPYKVTATDSALSAWSTPVALSGISDSHIDTTVVKVGSIYHAFLKSTSTKSIDFASSSSLTGPWTNTRTNNIVDYDGEGPVLVQLDNGAWRMYWESYQVHKAFYTDSYDTFQTWTTPTELPGVSGTIKHFTVIKETVPGGVTLPLNTTRSLQSANYPDRYVRFRSDSLGYVDQVTSSSDTVTKQSATFAAVPGLADANCYSFRAADGRYLRHYAFRARLDTDAGTTTFAKDATFCARPGTTAGTVRLESYNFPGRYLRHRAFELWLDQYEDSDTFRADSSFQAITPWA
ncbi:glycoside hydrolase family 43 protein [Streptomyces sp. NPDC096311]|uniref:glycoside hydrolase family 43 protein n=1 Tax=Streptomyces sp. NPDC096311 TaxID=3366083 RepID=UPI003802D1D5